MSGFGRKKASTLLKLQRPNKGSCVSARNLACLSWPPTGGSRRWSEREESERRKMDPESSRILRQQGEWGLDPQRPSERNSEAERFKLAWRGCWFFQSDFLLFQVEVQAICWKLAEIKTALWGSQSYYLSDIHCHLWRVNLFRRKGKYNWWFGKNQGQDTRCTETLSSRVFVI